MTDIEPEEDLPPVAHVTMVYNGPVAPHWEMRSRYGDQRMVDDFWTRVNARLLLLPKHDPQFRRNRERVNRDAERERIVCDWDLGDDDPETLKTTPAPAPGAPGSETAPASEATEVEASEQSAEAEALPDAEEPQADVDAPEHGDQENPVAESDEPEAGESEDEQAAED